MLLKRLQDHVDPDKPVTMTPSQIRAAEILLNKTLPNLTATEMDMTVDDTRAETMSDADLLSIVKNKGK
jgi:hypothetical protein